MIDYKNITMPELITTRRIVAKEIILVEEQMEEIERDYCFLNPEYDTIQWEDEKSEKCYFNLAEHQNHLKKSLQTLNHRMAVFN